MNTHKPPGRIYGVLSTFLFACSLMVDMFVGLFIFRKVPNSITIYGSARIKSDSKYYKMAQTLGEMLAKLDIPIMTGGGPGIMEAANSGASKANKPTYGCHISLPFEQKQNNFLTLSHETKYFFVRKYILRHSSQAVVAFPGGYGTMDELFECATLIRTNCAPQIPLILVGVDYWQPLYDFIGKTMLEHGTVSEIDINQLHITDDLEEVVSIIQKAINDQ